MTGFRNAIRRAAVLGVIALMPVSIGAQKSVSASPQSRDSRDGEKLMDRWLAAAKAHHPGTLDEPALEINDWPSGDVALALCEAAGVAARLDPIPTASKQFASTLKGDCFGFTRTAALAFKYQRPMNITVPALNAALRQGAMLHTDLAMLHPPSKPHPLDTRFLENHDTVLVRDGQVMGIDPGVLHWRYARVALDAIGPSPRIDPWVRTWYQATTAWQAADYRWSVVNPQLERGFELFPTDAVLLFYGGLEHECFSMSNIQAAREDFSDLLVRPNVKTAGEELALAERLLSQAVTADPGFAEARLHFGYVLGQLRRHTEALRELSRAEPGLHDSELLYYVDLFLGREHASLGDRAEAETALHRASARFPLAEAPHLELSYLAHESDATAATAILREMFSAPPDGQPRDDPWWRYARARPDDAADRIAEMKRQFAGVATAPKIAVHEGAIR